MYGCGGHLGYVTRTICINFSLPIIGNFHIKFEFNWPIGY